MNSSVLLMIAEANQRHRQISCWKASSFTLEESFTINKILSYLFAYPEIIRHLNIIWAIQWQLHPEMRLEMPKTRRPTEGVPGFKVSAGFFWKPFQSWENLYVTHIITWYHNRVWFQVMSLHVVHKLYTKKIMHIRFVYTYYNGGKYPFTSPSFHKLLPKPTPPPQSPRGAKELCLTLFPAISHISWEGRQRKSRWNSVIKTLTHHLWDMIYIYKQLIVKIA